MNRALRIAAIHDLSGFGRCSLTVILPVLSSMGMQVCPVPTAVLSTHTGGMGEVVLRDLSDYIAPALAHYQRLGIAFECVYTGFLGAADQIEHCLSFLKAYPGALAVVDPVMGDHGKRYRTMTDRLCRQMASLVAAAGLITPNLTEAFLLLGEPYSPAPLTRDRARSILVRLSEQGPAQVVITGAPLADGGIANLCFDRQTSAFWFVACDYVPVAYPGTGDLFAAVLTGALLQGDSLPLAVNRATRFCELAIKTTFGYGAPAQHGVMFERSLGALTERATLSDYQPL